MRLKENKLNFLFDLCIFLLLLAPCIVITLTNSSMMGDASNFFCNALSAFSDGGWYIENNFDHRARMSVMFLEFLPLNIAYFLFKIHSLKILSYVYAATLICLPVLLCIYALTLFKRSNKAEFSVFPLILLSGGVLPVAFYGCCEAYTAVFLFFIFFQYFLLNIKFNRFDYFVFLLLCLAVWDIHEAIVLFMPLVWVAYRKYSPKNGKILKFALINSIAAYIFYFICALTPAGPDILSDNAAGAAFLYPLWFGLILHGQSEFINFHLLFYLLFFINICAIFVSKKRKIHLIFALCPLVIFLFAAKYLYLYAYVMYRFICIYLLICISAFILFYYKKDAFLREIALRAKPLLMVILLITNVYIFVYSMRYGGFMKYLEKCSVQGMFYLNEDIESYNKQALSKDFSMGFASSPEAPAYSLIAVNSVQNLRKTKGFITAYDKNSPQSYIENGRLVSSYGALNIKLKTEFWDLTDFEHKFKNSQ